MIDAPATAVWEALTNPEIIRQWSGSGADMSEQIGKEWKLWDGEIWGKNIESHTPTKLVQEWYSGHWPEPSICTIELRETGEGTTVHLVHSDVPDDEAQEIELGWRDYYFEPMKELLERD